MRIADSKPALIAAAGAAAVIVVAIGVAVSTSASAAGSTPTPAASGAPSGAPGWHGGPGHGPGRGGPGFGGFGGPGGFGGRGGPNGLLLHGEQVVQQGTKVVTIDEQVGKITAVSAGSVTIKSTDGYTATYVLGTATRVDKNGAQAKAASLHVGDQVRVEGTKSGSTITAGTLMDGLPPRPAGNPAGMGPQRPGAPTVPLSPGSFA